MVRWMWTYLHIDPTILLSFQEGQPTSEEGEEPGRDGLAVVTLLPTSRGKNGQNLRFFNDLSH
jgi:hypothetical protein